MSESYTFNFKVDAKQQDSKCIIVFFMMMLVE